MYTLESSHQEEFKRNRMLAFLPWQAEGNVLKSRHRGLLESSCGELFRDVYQQDILFAKKLPR